MSRAERMIALDWVAGRGQIRVTRGRDGGTHHWAFLVEFRDRPSDEKRLERGEHTETIGTGRRRTIPLKALLQTKELSVCGILTQGAQLSRRQERVARQSRRRGAALLLGA
jgi:hypothetical protein